MTDMMTDIAHDELLRVLDYDQETGHFIWRARLSPTGPIGSRAGSSGPKGTWLIRLHGHQIYANRLAWFYVHGVWPTGHVVPKNGDRADSRIENLVEETRAQTVSRSKIRVTNTSGSRGVSWNSEKSKWVASITRNYKRIHLGFFDSKEAATAAYEASAQSGVPEGVGTVLPRKPSEARRSRWATYKTIRNAPELVGWETLEAFLTDMGEPPTIEHVLMRVSHSAPLGPGNAMWRLPWTTTATGNADAKRNYHLGRFGLSDVDYRRMLSEQKGVCAICKKPERQTFKGTRKQLCVDHDHATDIPRGLLCTSCNAMLGLVSDDPWLLRTAADYLELHAARNSNVVPMKKDTPPDG